MSLKAHVKWITALVITTSALSLRPATAAPPVVQPPSSSTSFNFDRWIERDLRKISDIVNIKMKVPPGAMLSRNGNGNVEVDLGDLGMLTVSQLWASDLAEAKSVDKSYYLKHDLHTDARELLNESNGFIYSRRIRTEENGHTYPLETHFVYYLVSRDGAIYSITEDVKIDRMNDVNAATFPPARAQALYNFVKRTAQVIEQ